MQRGGQIAVGGSALIALALSAAQFIEPFEGRVRQTYVDSAGYATACVGNRAAALPGATFTDEECDALLLADTLTALVIVRKLVKVPIDESQTVSLVSFVFNVGTGAFAKSTLLRRLNAGDYEGAAAELAKWRFAGGRELNGLVVRRAREARLFLS